LTARQRTPFDDKKALLEQWESAHSNAELLVYFTLTDRPNLGLTLQITDDALRLMSKLLQRGGKKDRVDLMIYTRGGSMNTAHSMVKTIRQFAKEFNVIVPLRAHSAGTQIALGADLIHE
jgi:ClpP class serine protease